MVYYHQAPTHRSEAGKADRHTGLAYLILLEVEKMKNRQELIEFLTNYIMNAPDKVLSLLYHFAINFTIKK